MNSKKFGLLIGITLVVLLLAIVTNRQHDASLQNAITGKVLYPQLAKQLNDVNEVIIESSEGIVNIHRSGDQWLVKQRSDYPADMSKLKSVVLSLADVTLIEAKTKLAESYSKLGVEEPDTKDSKSVRITLRAGNQELASTIVGNRASTSGSNGDNSRYVRTSKDPQSWLVKSNLNLDKDANQWLDTKLLDIKADRIHSIRFQQVDGSNLTVSKDAIDGKDYSVIGLPKNKEINSLSTINSLPTALQGLTLQDVVPAASIKLDKSAQTAEFMTYDGLKIDVTLQPREKDSLVIFRALFDPATRIAETDQSKGKLIPADEVKKEAENLQAQWQPWAYILSSANLSKLNKKLADISRDKKK